MKIENKSIINRLSNKILQTSKQKRVVSIMAIVMATLLFTTLFTITFSLNSSYQLYTFRQIGSYNHGSFKDISKEQIHKLVGNKSIRAYGLRTYIGFISDGVFSKEPAEISYMDFNTTKWSYIELVKGRQPHNINEVAMDISALKLLGISPELGKKVTLTFEINDRTQNWGKISREFILVGYWEKDELSPIHYINVSDAFVKQVSDYLIDKKGSMLRTDMNVMFSSSINIHKKMKKVLEHESLENISIGVNWGYSNSQISSNLGMGAIISIISILGIIFITGYLIISNIFYISIGADIRFWGLLKAIGTTNRQLRKIVYRQAIFLCVRGIPIGLLLGYIIGNILTNFIVDRIETHMSYAISKEHIIVVIFSSIFSFLTVMLSCLKSAKLVGKISPIEATKHLEGKLVSISKSRKKIKTISILDMAIANMRRNKKRGLIVIASITLSMVLFNFLGSFISGFDINKYLEKKTCMDFIVSSPEYFRYEGGSQVEITDDVIDKIRSNTSIVLSGSGYATSLYHINAIEEAKQNTKFVNNYLSKEIQIIGLDKPIFQKIKVIEGSLNSFF